MPPIFGRSKSLRTTAAELADSQPRIQKSKSFKRIRGLLRVGESRRERRARKEGRAAGGDDSFAVAGGGMEPDEVSTVMNVDVDDRSVATQSVVNPRLLEEQKGEVFPPTSSSAAARAIPSYILKVVLLLMDPETRRFELLQLEFDSHKALVADVLAQIPISVTEVALRKQVYTGIAGTDGNAMPPQQLLSSFCKGNEVVVAIPDGVTAYECTRLARPILSDDNVVAMLASSGIDASGWKEDKKRKKKAATATSSAGESDIAVQAEPLDVASTAGQRSGDSNGRFTILVVLAIFALLLQVFHVYISAPIQPGSTISPGIWLSQCGLLSLLPSFCKENAYVHFDRLGRVTYYNANKEVVWTMEGRVCPEDDEEKVECIRGMQVHPDGKIYVGGQLIHHVTVYPKGVTAPLSPWPFVETPKVKVWRK